jgi:hypothetical protein
MPLSADQVSDRIEINDLLVRYTRAIDTCDWDLLDTCFTPDAHIDYKSSGGVAGSYPEVRAWLAKALAQFDAMMHLVSNSSVELDGDSARARTYVLNPMGMKQADGSLHFFTVAADYKDRLVRTPEGWRIAERIEEQMFVQGGMPSGVRAPK